jgi:protein gp37
MSTKIDWADEVWNPTVGCEKVSLGCAYCGGDVDFERPGVVRCQECGK